MREELKRHGVTYENQGWFKDSLTIFLGSELLNPKNFPVQMDLNDVVPEEATPTRKNISNDGKRELLKRRIFS